MRSRFTGLWRHPDFLRLWVGQTISQFGSMITRDALSFTAILVLHATPAQMSLLTAAGVAPALLVGLPAGVWVDRVRRRRLLIATDLGRALLLLSIPLAALGGVLRIEQLFVVASLVGVLTVLFDVAYQSFLPSLLRREQLVEGNSKLGVSSSLAEIAGPAVGGALVQLLSAPLTILIDAVSFLCSALFLGRIRAPEPAPHAGDAGPEQRVWHDALEGVRAVLGDPLLRSLAGTSVTFYLSQSVIGPVYALYTLRTLGMPPAVLGVIIATGGGAALVGALLAGWVARRFGVGRALIGSVLLTGASALLIALAHGPLAYAVPLLMAAQIGDITLAIYAINELSLRQAITPDRLQGRINASMRVLEGGSALVGLLVGGVLGETIGLRPTIVVATLGMMLACLWLLFSPARRLRGLPAAPDPASGPP